VKVGLAREANKVRTILRDARRELSHAAPGRLRDVAIGSLKRGATSIDAALR
jgi:hypothetical protein